jgi:hypothetical protein
MNERRGGEENARGKEEERKRRKKKVECSLDWRTEKELFVLIYFFETIRTVVMD